MKKEIAYPELPNSLCLLGVATYALLNGLLDKQLVKAKLNAEVRRFLYFFPWVPCVLLISCRVVSRALHDLQNVN